MKKPKQTKIDVPEIKVTSLKDKLVKVLLLFFPKKNPNENIFQYVLRQLWLCDSRGNPSITVTILVYVMALVGAVSYVACYNAMQLVTFYDAAGKVIKTAPQGFADTFLVLVMGMTIVITGWYRQRQNKGGLKSDSVGTIPTGPAAIISKAKEIIGNVISGGGNTTPTNKGGGK